MAEKSSFVMHNEYMEIIEMLPDAEKGRLLMALMIYSQDGTVPDDLETATMMAFTIIRKRIDYDSLKYDGVCERNQKNGKRGGRPKASGDAPEDEKSNDILKTQRNPGEPNETQNNPEEPSENPTKPKKPDTDTDTDNDTDTEYIKRESKERDGASATLTRAPAKRFVKPSVDQVRAYCAQKGYPVDAQRFFDYYESNGWMVGKNHMKDWQAAVRNWNQRDRHGGQNGPVIKKNSFNNFPERQIDDWDLYELELLGDKRPEAEGE